jgi:uncharacterized protein
MSEGVERLKAAYEAFKHQDIATVMAAFDPDIEWVAPETLPFGGTYHGHDGVGGYFQQLPTYFQEIRVEPQEFVEEGDVVVAAVRLSGRGAGGALDSQTVHYWRMRGGRAVSFREYPDTVAVLQAIGHGTPGAG